MEIFLIIIAMLAGVLTGIVTGLIPGIHVNTVAALMVGLSGILFTLEISPIMIAVYIVATAITHSFYDFVPSLFLGVPAETFALLPGQRMVKEGKGLEALQLSIIGSWRGLLISIAILIILILIDRGSNGAVKAFERNLQPWMFWILFIVSIILIISEKQKFWAFIIFICSGVYGLTVFGSPLIPGGTMSTFNVLFPALTGLFGVSGLVFSLSEKIGQLSKQEKNYQLHVTNGEINISTVTGATSGMLVGLLPGLGGANAATLVLLIDKYISKTQESKNNGMTYILMTSAINTSDTLFGIAALYLINKSRSGASVAIDQLLAGVFSITDLLWIVGSILIAGLIAKLTLSKQGLMFSKFFSLLNYKAMSLSVLVFILFLVYFTTGLWGIIILVGASLIGILPPIVNVRRAQAMGFFLIPVLLFFSGYQREISSLFKIEAKVSPAQSFNLHELLISIFVAMVASVTAYIISKVILNKSSRS